MNFRIYCNIQEISNCHIQYVITPENFKLSVSTHINEYVSSTTITLWQTDIAIENPNV